MRLATRIESMTDLAEAEVINRMIAAEEAMRHSLTQERKRLFAVEGNIGTGKSTLARLLATRI